MDYLLFPHFRFLRADNGGCAHLPVGWVHPRRLLSSSVLILGSRGSVPIVIGDAEYSIDPGTVVLLPAGLVHFGRRPLDAPAVYYWFHFTLSEAPAILRASDAKRLFAAPDRSGGRLDGAALLPLRFRINDPEPFFQEFRELLFEQEKPCYTCLKFQLLFQELLIGLTEYVMAASRPTESGSSGSSIAYSIVTLLLENVANPNVSIKSIAGELGLHPDYAGRRFRETMGLSVGNYILKKRMELAVSLLQETADSVEQIAGKCGFNDFRHFLRQFKAERGITPTEARRRHRIMHVNAL